MPENRCSYIRGLMRGIRCIPKLIRPEGLGGFWSAYGNHHGVFIFGHIWLWDLVLRNAAGT